MVKLSKMMDSQGGDPWDKEVIDMSTCSIRLVGNHGKTGFSLQKAAGDPLFLLVHVGTVSHEMSSDL